MKKDKKATKEIIDKAAERLAEIFIKQIELKKETNESGEVSNNTDTFQAK